MSNIVYNHGNKKIIFNTIKLELFITRHGWRNLDEFIQNANYEQVEFVLNFGDECIIKIYDK